MSIKADLIVKPDGMPDRMLTASKVRYDEFIRVSVVVGGRYIQNLDLTPSEANDFANGVLDLTATTRRKP